MENYKTLFVVLVLGGVALLIIDDISTIIRNKTHWYKESNGKYYLALNIIQILTRIDDYETAYYEIPKPKYRLYQVYTLILFPICFGILIAYNIFVVISIYIFALYGYCFLHYYKVWKLYGRSKIAYWSLAIFLCGVCIILAPYIRAIVIGGVQAAFNCS